MADNSTCLPTPVRIHLKHSRFNCILDSLIHKKGIFVTMNLSNITSAVSLNLSCFTLRGYSNKRMMHVKNLLVNGRLLQEDPINLTKSVLID